MGNCIYIYKGHKFNSEIELDDFLLNSGDKLYSKYGDLAFQSYLAANTCNQLDIISLETKKYLEQYQKAKELAKYLDGEEIIEFKPPYIGVTLFIKGLKNEEDELLTPEFREIEYWKRRIKDWKDENKGFNDDEIALFGKNVTIVDNVSETELKEYLDNFDTNPDTDNTTLLLIKLMKEKWIALGKLGTAIHEVLRRLFTTSKNGILLDSNDDFLLNKYFNTSLLNKIHPDLTQEKVKSIIEYARGLRLELESKLEDSELLYFPEFLMTSKIIKDVPGKGDTLFGIIDLLVVDSLGNVHIIDYKASPKDSFNSAKERSFWYLLGIYKRMTQANGLKVSSKTPSVLVAPIKMEGFRRQADNNFTLDSISNRDADYLTDISFKSDSGKVALNLDEFFDKQEVKDLVPEDLIENVTKFESKVFAGINTSKLWTDEEIKKTIESNGNYDIDNPIIRRAVKIREALGLSEAELFEKVKKYYTEIIPQKLKDTFTLVVLALRKGIKENTDEIELPRISYNDSASSLWFKNLISKYCKNTYLLLENNVLDKYGIILIQNKVTKLIDVLKITSDFLDIEHKFNKSSDRKLITGGVELDYVLSRKPGTLALVANNGNIHLMETMAVLNCLPLITLGNSSIGNILVANPYTLQGMPASNEELLYNFNELAKHVDNYQNNMKLIRFVNKVELARNRLHEIIEAGTNGEWLESKYKFFKRFTTPLTELDDAISSKDKRKMLRLLEEIRKDLEKYKSADIDPSLEIYNEDANIARSLYDKVVLALAELLGITFRQLSKDNSKFIESMNIFKNGVQSLMFDNPGNLNNETLNSLTKLVTSAYLNVREDVTRELVSIRKAVDKLKDSKGFGKTKEMTTGNAALLFKNMLEYKDGDILFKNPWNIKLAATMSSEETEFLKMVITKINEDRFPEDYNYQKENADLLYFRVPLAVGSLSSQAAQLGGLYKGLRARLDRLNPVKWWEETLKTLTGVFSDSENLKHASDLYKMSNMFDESHSLDDRLEIIREKGEGYFENNLETLLIKHIFAYSTLKHVDAIMPMAKASMIHLVTLGHLTNQKYINATNYVTDYIKNKIKNESIIDEKFKNANAVISRMRQAASFLSLAFSPVSFGYLNIQGLWLDIRLMIQNEEGLPFTFENFVFAFKEVYRDLFKLGGKPTKCSLLNELYGINDMDMNTYADKIKSDRYGLYNWTNLAYHCSSRPDYFNRMIILVALMKHLGTWDAYSVDKDGRLVYNWKEDKRFSVYARGDKNHPDYNRQRGLYLVMAELLEREHALKADGSYFKVGDDLPKAYTNLESESLKAVSDDIYGYYSHEKKSMILSMTIGALWMQMKGYWSGKKNQYLGSAGVKLLGSYKQLKDDEGNLLWLKEENGLLIPTTEDTGLPLMKWEGEWLEGILLTIANLYTNGKENGFKLAFIDMWLDPEKGHIYRANIKLLIYDTVMFTTIGPILAGMMVGWDDELEKDAKKSGRLDEATISSAAHMCMKMVSSSFGDLNFVESIGAPIVSWQPFALSYFSRRMDDIMKIATGDMDITDALIRMTSVTANSKTFLNAVIAL